jgi:hypothetical protein
MASTANTIPSRPRTAGTHHEHALSMCFSQAGNAAVV